MVKLWKAFLKDDPSALNEIAKASPAFIFPYRTETVSALTWAVAKNNSWKFKYYLGLNYWAIQRENDARKLFDSCKQEPDFATFYLSRAYLEKQTNENQVLSDLQTAHTLAPGEWRASYRLIEQYISLADYKTAFGNRALSLIEQSKSALQVKIKQQDGADFMARSASLKI